MRSARSAGLEASIWLKAVWAFSYLPSCIRRRADSYRVRACAREASGEAFPAPAMVFGRLTVVVEAFFMELLFLSQIVIAGTFYAGLGKQMSGTSRETRRTECGALRDLQIAMPILFRFYTHSC